MGSRLPEISLAEFEQRLEAACPRSLPTDQMIRLHRHYQELRRWNRTVSLVGPAAADEIVERHYGESLAATPLLPEAGGVLVDIGSGAGFPGLVLAVARPDLAVTLVEARERKWSFLRTVCRQLGLATICLNARVERALVDGLPTAVDRVTARAVRFDSPALEVLTPRLSNSGSLLFWAGRENPVLSQGMRISRQIDLPGSTRRILEIRINHTDDAQA